jgi:GntR family transcriptional regulator, transcriptional repressor for pyruvate dehydrogenase complex
MSTVVAFRRPNTSRRAEMVAGQLRARILSGSLSEGDLLPKQDELLAEFGVSLPCLREAFRVLETEGLITVLRGKFGGAAVHPPNISSAAYMIGLVLHSRAVQLADLSRAIAMLEPIAAAACARRPDRAETVLPALRGILDRAADAIDDIPQFLDLAREFHTAIVTSCGNETFALLVGTLEILWSAQIEGVKNDPDALGIFAERAQRLQRALDHERIYRLISEGDSDGVRMLVEQHFHDHGGTTRYALDYAQEVRPDA